MQLNTTLGGFEKRHILELPTSERLYFKFITAEHSTIFYDMNNDPEVLRYTGDEPFESLAAATQFIENYPAYKTYGIGRWAMHLKTTDEPIGWCGLRYNAEADEVDLGYRLIRKFWGQGYATEAAEVCLQFGFQKLAIPVIVGKAMPANGASVRVLQKIGMTFQRMAIEHDGEEVVVYAAFNRKA